MSKSVAGLAKCKCSFGCTNSGVLVSVTQPVSPGLRVGQRVLAFHSNGGYAEKVAVPAGQVFPIPDSIPYQSAVLLPLNYGTAYIALYRTGPVESGMRVFIHAAAGGVGMAAVDLARRAGLEVVAAASTHFKRSRLIAEGVKHVVPSSRTRVHKLSKRLFGGPAFDIVLDSIGGRSIGDGLRALKPGGRFVFVTTEPPTQPNGKTESVSGTNNEAERTLRGAAEARKTGRTNKTPVGARRQTIIVSVLESLRVYLSIFTLTSVLEEINRWWQAGQSCFTKLLKTMKLQPRAECILDKVMPAPDG
jgi:NADPH:quinone reductase-like Zn-dependent oxidoreductase